MKNEDVTELEAILERVQKLSSWYRLDDAKLALEDAICDAKHEAKELPFAHDDEY
jgi:hypothetical protein